MTVSLEQKVDFLLKKLGYAATKTGIAEDESLSGTKKAPFAEAIASPLVVPASSVWQESDSIPATPPESTTGVLEYHNSFRMTVDPTVSGNRTYIAHATWDDTSSSISGDWVDTQFSANYIVKVYKNDPTGPDGEQLPAGGSGSNDTWFFDYSSGVLNFNGSNVPSGVLDSNIYIVAHRYVGTKGVGSATASVTPQQLEDEISALRSKFISVDERIESIVLENNSYVKLEDNTTAAVDGLPTFYDGSSGGDTTRFIVTQDDRGVYSLDNVPQPTVELPRSDTIEFDLSGLADEDEFELYTNGNLLTAGKSRVGSILSMNASQIPLSITKVFYKNTQTSGLGWVISILDN